jgi:hypothetical protein
MRLLVQRVLKEKDFERRRKSSTKNHIQLKTGKGGNSTTHIHKKYFQMLKYKITHLSGKIKSF